MRLLTNRESMIIQMREMIREHIAQVDQIADLGEFPRTMGKIADRWVAIAIDLDEISDDRLQSLAVELRASMVNAMHMLEEDSRVAA
jgi:hypothetical protein